MTKQISKYFGRIIFPAILLSIPYSTYCQDEKVSDIITSVAEELADNDSDPEAVTAYVERLQELNENPVKINSSAYDEISRLFFLSDFQARAISDYVHTSGSIISVYELVNIPGFDRETAEMMIPFISLDNVLKSDSDSAGWRSTLLTNLSLKPGKRDTSSAGSSLKVLTKYKFTSGSFSGGITVEKDPGEKFFPGSPPLPDFLSAHLAYSGNGPLRKLIVGDYSARFGQGTNINTGTRAGLSLTSPGYMSASDEIRPYTSTDENNFFRGIAAQLSLGNLSVSLFYSKHDIDATISSSSGVLKGYIENFYLSGLHNTPSLLMKKDAVSEQNYGLNLSYNFHNIRIGFTLSEDRFSLPVNSKGADPEKVFDFEGDKNKLYTVYYNSLIKRVLLYGEFSTNQYFKYAVIQGLSLRPSDRLTINFSIRDYNAGYVSFHGKGSSGSQASGNEQGITGNFTFEAAKHLFVIAGCGIEYFPWLKYRCSSPSRGIKKELRVRYLPADKLTIEALYSYRQSLYDNPGLTGIPELKQVNSRSIKFSIRYTLHENLIIGTRLDYKTTGQSDKGMLLLGDLNYRFKSNPLSIWLRYCLYKTDDYESRLYTWENDMLYSFSIPALYGRGSRVYIMTGWKIGHKAEIRFKYSVSSVKGNPAGVTNNEEFRMQLKVTI